MDFGHLFAHINLAPALNSVLGGIAGAAIHSAARKPVMEFGEHIGELAVGSFERIVPEGLRPAVAAELHSLSNSAQVGMTVNDAASTVLGKVGKQFPQAALTDVSAIVGDFALAFEAGLAKLPQPKVTPDATAPEAKPAA